MTVLAGLAATAAGAWVWLLVGRGWYWRTDVQLPPLPPDASPARWPSVTVIVPARNEAQVLPSTLPALLAQDYPGCLRIVVVDDSSTDHTSEVARSLGARSDARDVNVVTAPPLPHGWAGKVWAMHTGAVSELAQEGEFILLTDADIAHPPDLLRRLVGMAESQDLDLASVMAHLRAITPFERLLVPAFVYFFGLLYPFRWSNDPNRETAAAAGGCVLVKRRELQRIGGLESLRGEIIDDCALAARIKQAGGRIWLGLGADVRSERGYAGLSGVWHVVARTAYTQLAYSPIRLLGTVVALLLAFAAPPVAAVVGGASLVIGIDTGSAATALASGILGWALMTYSYLPMTRWYGGSALRAVTLPLSAAIYVAMTLDSARRHYGGVGGAWKGRTYT
ncbi:MAG: glycosyltransferase [Chloroflexi bacterium]|nr:glycosyltransferase [Chloroflexota bacterium]